MQFGPEVETALRTAAALVNTLVGDQDELADVDQLATLLARFEPPMAGSQAELADVRALRTGLSLIWRSSDPATVAESANRLMRRGRALPRLVHLDDAGWRVRLTDGSEPLAHRIAVEAGAAFVALICADDLGRLKLCAAAGCEAVLVDLSRNRSRRFCDTGNCGNRQHVAAYRARKLTSVNAGRS